MDLTSFEKYLLDEGNEKKLWENCVFIFDSSALIELYYYSESLRQEIFSKFFDKMKGRLWIPNHVLFEYLKNRESAIRKSIDETYTLLKTKFLSTIQEAIGRTQNNLKELKEKINDPDKHPNFGSEDIDTFKEEVSKSFQKFKENIESKINEKEEEILKLEQDDTILKSIKKNFESGEEYSYKKIIKITKKGKHRYEFKIPPGYMDSKSDTDKKAKKGTQIFGDLIIWQQILDYASEQEKDIVFVCNDVKEDWWNLKTKSIDKKFRSPRLELIKEFNDLAGKKFWMYNSALFLEKANELLQTAFTEEQIKQVSELIAPAKELIKEVSFAEGWRLNHWGSNCAKIEDDKMIFEGTTAPNGTDGSHIDLMDFLEIGTTYEVSCFGKSIPNTSAQFQLWCHDNTGVQNKVSETTPYKTLSEDGEIIKLPFKAQFTKNMRIHLQYNPGTGQIAISDVKIYKLL